MKTFLMILVIGGLLGTAAHFAETGDAIKVISRDGEVCGCMYDETGFKGCDDSGDVEYVVIEASTCN